MRFAACVVVAFVFNGCVSGSDVVVSDVEMGEVENLGEMTVADLLANGKYEAAEQLARVRISGGRHPFPYAKAVVEKSGCANLKGAFGDFPPCSDSDITMHRLNLCSVLLLMGKKNEAHLEMLKARDELENMFDPESQALKLTHGEYEKYFKGDGYERATLYAFLALSFLEKGDFANALKCIQNGILADSDSENADFRGDYALLPYIGYVAASKAGENWHQETQKYDRLVKELTGIAPSESAFPKSLLVVWTGRGSDRTLGGEFDEKRYVRKGSSRGLLDSVSVVADEKECLSFSGLADLNFQATTRGRRVMDLVLDRKASAKRGLAASSNALLAFGAGCIEAGTVSGNIGFATVMFSVGGLFITLGCPTYFIGLAINATADDRCWQSLPGRLIVVPLPVAYHPIEAKIRAFRRLDNVFEKNMVLDLSCASGRGIPVNHISLIADRDAIEQNINRYINNRLEVVAARTKSDFFADKSELTEEGD